MFSLQYFVLVMGEIKVNKIFLTNSKILGILPSECKFGILTMSSKGYQARLSTIPTIT